MFPFEIVPAGDAAILVQYPERIDPELNEQCIALANTIGTRLRSAVLDVVHTMQPGCGWQREKTTSLMGVRE